MSEIQTICDTILAHLRRYDRKIAGMLNPGLAEPVAREMTYAVPTVIPDSAYEFYARRNGYSGPVGGRGGGDFFPGWYMMEMKKCIDVYQMCCDEPMVVWKHNWFPIFRTCGADFYGVVCHEAPTDDGPIIHSGEGDDDIGTPEFESLEAMLKSVADGYADGVFQTNQDGFFMTDWRRFGEIARKYNPTVRRWAT